jgi:urea carboxylase
VTAIHPGYGFLSENEEFCGSVEAAGIAWLGPTAKTLHDFALKHVARKIAEEAGVSRGLRVPLFAVGPRVVGRAPARRGAPMGSGV